MKIYFGASTSQFTKYQKNYFNIRDLLVEEGHILTRDWIGIYRDDLMANPGNLLVKENDNPKRIYEITTKALYEAELLIVENTVPSFSNGHLITLGLQRKMPSLVLTLESGPKRYLKKSFIQGIDSEYFDLKTYNKDNYKEVIRSFIRKYSNSYLKHRFHLVIDEVERKYVDWAQHQYDTSRTDVIRKAIRNALENDGEYRRYLQK